MSPLGFSWGSKGRRSGGRKSRFPPKSAWVQKKSRTSGALVQKVNRLAAAQRGTRNRIYYNQQETLSLATLTGAQPSTIIPLTNFSYWTRTFGTDADDEASKRAIIQKSSVQYVVSANGELDQIGVSIFLVQLKKNAARMLDGNGTLQATFTSGQHYTGVGSRVLLNPEYFKIWGVRRAVLGDVAATRGGGTSGNPTINNFPMKENFTGRFNVKYNGGKGMTIVNPYGDWKASNPTTTTNNFYLLCFCDDSTTDTKEANIQYNAVHVVDAA